MLLTIALSTLMAGNAAHSAEIFSSADYNIRCPHIKGEVLFNTYRYEVGLRENLKSQNIISLETLVIDPNDECQDCFDITTHSPNSESIYLFAYRAKPTPTVQMFSVLENGILAVILEKTECYQNSLFDESQP